MNISGIFLKVVLKWHFFKSHAVAFCLKAMLKLDQPDILFQELYVENSRSFDVVSRLLRITPHLHFGGDAISHS